MSGTCSHDWAILTAAGIDPAPRRDTGPSWAQFLPSQAEALLAANTVLIDQLEEVNGCANSDPFMIPLTTGRW